MRQSRLLAALDAAVQAATTQLSADCIRAERACYFARQGRTDEARLAVAALRQQYANAPNAEMSAWLSLAEGLEIYFRHLGAGSHDKVLRAYVLSVSAGLTSMQALSSAWLAQMDFTRLDVESMARHVQEALRVAKPQDYAARARASLVLAQSLHFARRLNLAMPWYRRAHSYAIEQGDDATISALMHNMACMRLDNLRQEKLMGLPESNAEFALLTGTESTNRFDQMIGATSLQALNPLLIARVHSLQGRPDEALRLYDDHVAKDPGMDFARMRSDLLSDVAWCCFQMGQRERAVSSALEAEASLIRETQIDDRASTHTRLGWLYSKLGDADSASRHQSKASAAWNNFEQLQDRIVQVLGTASEEG